MTLTTEQREARAAHWRAMANRARPGSTLIAEYRQRACGYSPGHDYLPSQPSWAECIHCGHVMRVASADLTCSSRELSPSAQRVYSARQLYQQDRAWHFESRQAVGSAWAEALRGGREMTAELAGDTEPDTREATLGCPWTAGRLPGRYVSIYPVYTAHMWPRVRNGWGHYQPGTWDPTALINVRKSEGM